MQSKGMGASLVAGLEQESVPRRKQKWSGQRIKIIAISKPMQFRSFKVEACEIKFQQTSAFAANFA
jgi:hypothetical protein